MPPLETFTYYQYRENRMRRSSVDVITEKPLTLTVNGVLWLTFMCTPTDIKALAVGFLYNEGIVERFEEIAEVYLCKSEENIDVWLNKDAEKPTEWRHTTGCAGGVTSSNGFMAKPLTQDDRVYAPQLINNLIGLLFESQDLYRSAGGAHASALSDGDRMLLVCEDVGRHNTLDKIAGRMLLDNLRPNQRILLTTGRLSSEMLQKSARIGAPLVISRTSPTSASVHIAHQLGITLIGYARRSQFNIYSHPERIQKS